MGSVKDLEVVRKPTRSSMGIGRFIFSDRYSVFDWGEMPDLIEGKGESLCIMAAHCFEKLRNAGIRTHYRGLVTKKGERVQLSDIKQPTDTMEVNLVNVLRPKAVTNGKLRYDYSIFTPDLNNFLIPLEIIYRNGLPEGSSVFHRLEQGFVTLKELGLDHYPQCGEKLAQPIFDVSTKLEDKDRYITWKEAKTLAYLSDDELKGTKNLLAKTDAIITQIAAKAGLANEDGKIELAFDPERKLMIVDVVGTLDECRFTRDGLHVSKEIARQFYRKTKWYRDVEEAKREAETKGVQNWKSLCKSEPPNLDPTLKRIISHMYMAASNELTDRKIFEVSSLASVIQEYMKYPS